MLYWFSSNHSQGIFCNDESLMYPFQQPTMSHEVLYIIGTFIPLLTIVTTEFMRKKHEVDDDNDDGEKQLKMFGRTYSPWFKLVFKFCGTFLFGAIFTILITNMSKNAIGRYRPHFINVCHPLIPPGNTTCSDPANWNRYILNFYCNNADVNLDKLKTIRQSFPSVHASFSVYTMTFAAIYLHCRMNFCHSCASLFIKINMQLIFNIFALITSLKRISDYQSHCKLI